MLANIKRILTIQDFCFVSISLYNILSKATTCFSAQHFTKCTETSKPSCAIANDTQSATTEVEYESRSYRVTFPKDLYPLMTMSIHSYKCPFYIFLDEPMTKQLFRISIETPIISLSRGTRNVRRVHRPQDLYPQYQFHFFPQQR